jgi:malto-oligosyltrehalose trehalohydrolase
MVVKRMHDMPFGAQVGADGTVTFGLWAPAANTVAARIQTKGGRLDLPMAKRTGGWHTLATHAPSAGDLYSYVIDGERVVPDPASRYQPHDVHGRSLIVDPRTFEWTDTEWRGRPWEETVLYELHVGTFTPEGTYAAAIDRLDSLVSLGITAVELMPLAEAPGAHNWGYDGVELFAPEARYGTPDDLKRFVAEAHRHKLMVFVDVVYNHFGPEGNYLSTFAPQFFTDRHQTPWGSAIAVDGPHSRPVRDFYLHNAMYWLEEYNVDGLRFDAVHAILDDSEPHVLNELSQVVRQRLPGRHIHLVLENDDNAAWALARGHNGEINFYTAQWNDDLHHALHVLITDETHGYYGDYALDPGGYLARTLGEGFAYQGEPSPHRDGKRRGEKSGHLPPTAFVSFLQNHDQIGNRPLGERISAIAPPEAVRAATAIVLLSPQIPLIFMGEEWAAEQPFQFFCDFGPELSAAVREGRAKEFAHFFETALLSGGSIPDPTSPEAFQACILHWSDRARSPHVETYALFRRLLDIRHQHIIPRLKGARASGAVALGRARRVIAAEWTLGDGSLLRLIANLDRQAASVELPPPEGELLFTSDPTIPHTGALSELPPWLVTWHLQPAKSGTD